MKDSMLSLDIYAWVNENRYKIEGGFFKKIYQVGEREFLFKIYREETRSLYVNLRGWICFKSKETPLEPSMFVMFLRKRFYGKKILRFYQLNFDRIVIFETYDRYKLIIELFGEGNIIVTKDDIIEKAYLEREWRHRSIIRGIEYVPPPQSLHPLKDLNKLCEEVNISKLDLVRTLARRFNLGKYAEEVCARAEVDKNKKEISVEECERLKREIKNLFNFDGGYVYENFFSPIKLKMYSNILKDFKNFNDALVNYLREEGGIENPEILSIKRRIIEIERSIEKFSEEEKRNKEIGDLIYAHFGEIEQALQYAREGKLDYDKKRKVLEVKYGGYSIKLHIYKSLGENASSYYEMAKKMRDKIKGAREALKNANEELKDIKKKKEKKKKELYKNRRRFWFEKYRWFISSEGILVVGGRNAKTNEEVVKKHLNNGDLYMHADIRGAPSLVIKSEGKKIEDKTLYEAAQFAVSMSKAWNAGLGSLSAYWVYPSQLSKMGESGEYVARGAWVVHGKRNYIHKVPLRLGIGKIKYRDVEMVMCGPEDSIKSMSERYVIIEPGDTKKDEIAKKISQEYGISLEESLRLLPPGKIRIIEAKSTKFLI